MERPIHASEDLGKDDTVPRIVAVAVGVMLIGIVAGGLMYSGMWSPANPTQISASVVKH